MNNTTLNTPDTNNSWDTYWKGTEKAGAFTSGGVSHPAIKAFWHALFQSYHPKKMLDIASGNGAVIESALEFFGDKAIEITSLDVSEAAIRNIHERFPNVQGIVSNATSIPKEDASFDIVTSQYGVEYAGHDAIFEAARLVKKEGKLALLMHCEAGHIHAECQQSIDAIKRVQQCSFIQLAKDMFEAGFKAVQGADRKPYEQTAKKLSPAITQLENIMTEYGTDVAGNTVSRLYNDVGQIHQRMQHYDPKDVLGWLSKMEEEIKAYASRMSSMSLAAIKDTDFNKIKNELSAQGFSIETADKLFSPDNPLPMAWVLIAQNDSV